MGVAAGFRDRARAAPSLNAGVQHPLHQNLHSTDPQFPSWECPVSFSAFHSLNFFDYNWSGQVEILHLWVVADHWSVAKWLKLDAHREQVGR